MEDGEDCGREQFARQLLTDQSITMYDDGTSRRDYTFVSDSTDPSQTSKRFSQRRGPCFI